jgi:hypothetical protein
MSWAEKTAATEWPWAITRGVKEVHANLVRRIVKYALRTTIDQRCAAGLRRGVISKVALEAADAWLLGEPS